MRWLPTIMSLSQTTEVATLATLPFILAASAKNER